MKDPFLRFYLDSREDRFGKRKIFVDISIGYAEVDYGKEIQNYDSERKKYKPIKLFTGCRIKADDFGRFVNRGSKRVFTFDKKVFDKYSKTNKNIKVRLKTIEDAVDEVVYLHRKEKKIPNPKEFKKMVQIELGDIKREVIKEKSVLEFLYDKVEKDREDAQQGKKSALSPNYIKTYVSLSRMFENYELAAGDRVMFSNFNNPEFQWEFFRIIDAIYRDEIKVDNPNQSRKQLKDPTGYGAKSINKNIKLLHRVLKLGKEKGYNMTLNLSDPGLMLQNPPPEKEIYLNEDEIKKAIDAKVEDLELLNARQYLIIACLTGLRIEDMSKLHSIKPKTFSKNGNSFRGIKLFINKTKTEVIIPLLKPVEDILSENGGVFPVFKEIVNKHLKRLCLLLEIDSIEKRSKISFREGKVTNVEVPKYELVSTHDCRRSFITNLGLKDVSQDIVSSMTHPKKKDNNNMMMVYNNATLADKAMVFLNALEKVKSDVYYE